MRDSLPAGRRVLSREAGLPDQSRRDGNPTGALAPLDSGGTASTLCEAAAKAFRLVDDVAEGVVRLVSECGEHRIACRRGCNPCCTTFVSVTHAEAVSIATWLRARERSKELERFRGQVAQWRVRTGTEVALLEAVMTRGDDPAEPPSREVTWALKSYRRKGLMCPFNADDGSCGIYPARPVACRAFFVADTAENCPLDARGGVAIVRHEKLTGIVRLVRRALRAASADAGCDKVLTLPAGVERALSGLENGPQVLRKNRTSGGPGFGGSGPPRARRDPGRTREE